MKVFFCGVGGSGMSGLARYFLSEGCQVFGSDMIESYITSDLQKEGLIFLSPSSENITENIDLFIRTEAISNTHSEFLKAQELNIPCKKYAEALGDITKEYYTIAVAGTHGKSSTTAMVATMLKDAGKEVVSIVGANIHDWGNKNFLSANKGASDGMPTKKYLVIESCEYRESFLHYNVNGIVLTTLEVDHLDYFKTEEAYFNAFQRFLIKLPSFGFFVSYLESANVRKVLPPNFHPRKFSAEEEVSQVPSLKVLGGFQRTNAALVLATAQALKIDEEIAKKSLSEFSGLSRRFEKKGEKNGILVFDDYAHHPTAITSLLSSAREYVKQYNKKKIWIVFQPHQFSRTADFLDDLSRSFMEADDILIPNIYESRDSVEDKARISADELVKRIENIVIFAEKKQSNVWGRGNRKRGEVFYKKRVRHSKTFKNTLEILNNEAYEGDVILFVGAGDISSLSERFLAS